MRPHPFLLPLLAPLLLLLPSSVRAAACTVTLVSPANNTTQIQSPLLRWSGACPQYRVHYSPSGTFVGDVVMGPWGVAKQYKMAENTWDSYQSGTWTGGVYWKVQSKAADGTLAFSATTRRMFMDPNLDDDAFSVSQGDCQDGNPAIYPGATETCNSIDDDCDAGIDEGFDLDGDSYTSCGGDCDDTEPLAHPGIAETCSDGIDNDCNGTDNGCDVSGEYSASAANTILVGENAEDSAGGSVSGIGDVNGDGYGDILVGAQNRDSVATDSGSAYLFLGPVPFGIVDLSSADAIFTGQLSGDNAGHWVGNGGDLNGDGYGEVIFSADKTDEGGPNSGTVYIFYGPISGTHSVTEADAKVVGENGNDEYGHRMQVGDFDDDGMGDLLIASAYVDAAATDSGAAYLFSGPLYGSLDASSATARIAGVAANDHAAHSLTCPGDVNGDGHDDLLMGAESSDAGGTNSGAAYLFYGPISGFISASTADAVFTGEASGDSAGSAVNGPGDFNGDGMDDLVIAANDRDVGGVNAGRIYIFFGPVASGAYSLSSADVMLDGAPSESAGNALGASGDFDADGVDDLVVGASSNDAGGVDQGAAYLVYGPITTDSNLDHADVIWSGEAAGDQLGWHVAIVPDTDGNGTDEVLLGARKADRGGSNSGVAYLFLGAGL